MPQRRERAEDIAAAAVEIVVHTALVPMWQKEACQDAGREAPPPTGHLAQSAYPEWLPACAFTRKRQDTHLSVRSHAHLQQDYDPENIAKNGISGATAARCRAAECSVPDQRSAPVTTGGPGGREMASRTALYKHKLQHGCEAGISLWRTRPLRRSRR